MFLWDYLRNCGKPIVIYGMGNGADKAFDLCDRFGLKVSAVFASDDHARGNLFHELPVLKYADICETYTDAVILLAFGVYQQEVLDRIFSFSERFEVFSPDLPLMGGDVLSPEYVSMHKVEIESARALLSDDISRFVFDSVLEAKQTGDILLLRGCETKRLDDLKLFSFTDSERYLDLGAYTGDTIQEFLALTDGKYAGIDAFEPDDHNYKKLLFNTAEMHNVTLYPCASWSENTTLTFTGKGGRNCAMKPQLPGKYTHIHEVSAISVDCLRKDYSFVKMDVEGAEAETLLGMKETLNRCHPKLFISAYHMTDDFIILPNLLQRLCPGYRMYLRKNPCLPAWEIQLLAIWPE